MWYKVLIVDLFSFLVEAETASLDLLVRKQFFILLLVAHQIMFFEAALIQVTLGTPIEYTLKVTSPLSILMYLKVLF